MASIKDKPTRSATPKRDGEGRTPRIRSSHGAPPKAATAKDVPQLAPRRASMTKTGITKTGITKTAGPKVSIPKATGLKAGGPKTKKASAAAKTESTSVASDESRQTAILIAVAALEKKAVGLEILDVAGKVDYADFLVLMTGRSDRQVIALSQGIEEALRKKNQRPLSVEGLPHANWVLMDFGDVVVHIFQDETRGLYDLEGLWLDARRLSVPIPEDLR